MAALVFGFASSHGPQLNIPADQWHLLQEKDQSDRRMDYNALLQRDLPGIAEQITPEKWAERYQACHAALDALRRKVASVAPDIIVVIGDDQHEQFLANNMPTFAVYYGAALNTVRRGRRENAVFATAAGSRPAWQEAEATPAPEREFPAAPELAGQLIRTFMNEGVDVATCDGLRPEVGIGHAFSFLYRYITPEGQIPVVPFLVNTFFPPNQPTPRRCYEVGQALRRAIEAWPTDARVAVMASGGLSHVIIDEEIDRMTLGALQRKDVGALQSLPEDRLTWGTSEIRNWIVAAGALQDKGMGLVDYVPCYRSPAGTGCAMGFATWE